MSNPLTKINFRPNKESSLLKNLKRFSPIRKTKTSLNSSKKYLPIRKAKSGINTQLLSNKNTILPEGNSQNTPETLPNSFIKSFPKFDLDEQIVCFNELAKLNTKVGELDLKMNKNMHALESKLKRNKELNEKFKIMEKDLLVRKRDLNTKESPGCTNNCRLW